MVKDGGPGAGLLGPLAWGHTARKWRGYVQPEVRLERAGREAPLLGYAVVPGKCLLFSAKC